MSRSHRLSVISRSLAAIVGGYALTALATAGLALLLPMPLVEATLVATMLSFVMYAGIVLWVFATRSAIRAWSGIVLAALLCYALPWLGKLVTE